MDKDLRDEVRDTPHTGLLDVLNRAYDTAGVERILSSHHGPFPNVDDRADEFGFAPITDATVWHCACGEDIGTTRGDVDSLHRHHQAEKITRWVLTGEES